MVDHAEIGRVGDLASRYREGRFLNENCFEWARAAHATVSDDRQSSPDSSRPASQTRVSIDRRGRRTTRAIGGASVGAREASEERKETSSMTQIAMKKEPRTGSSPDKHRVSRVPNAADHASLTSLRKPAHRSKHRTRLHYSLDPVGGDSAVIDVTLGPGLVPRPIEGPCQVTTSSIAQRPDNGLERCRQGPLTLQALPPLCQAWTVLPFGEPSTLGDSLHARPFTSSAPLTAAFMSRRPPTQTVWAIMDLLMPVSALPSSASLAVPLPAWLRTERGLVSSDSHTRSESPASPASMYTPESWHSGENSGAPSTCSTPSPACPAAPSELGRGHGASLISALEAIANASATLQRAPIVPPRSSSMESDLLHDLSKPLPALPPESPDRHSLSRASSAGRSASHQSTMYALPQQSKSAPLLPSPMREHPPPVPSAVPTSDAVRSEKRYRALLELVSTEHAYLEDLRILRDIYFPPLATATFGSVDVQERIARNADDLVALHERLGVAIDQIEDALHWQVGDGDVSHRSDSRVLQAVEAVCRAFAQEAPSFAIYADFCAQHPDATALIAQCADSKIEYEAYERQCAAQLSARAIAGPKLRLLDYAIKPVQRICRYPLTIAYLLKCVDEGSLAHRAVSEALAAMKEAATEVDNARVTRDSERKTIVVARRMEMPSSAQPAFISFLGQIELVGALQFLHLTPTLSAETSGQPLLKVKYLGALLYPTHIVFVKVKKADCYEPRHWFPLRAVSFERTSEADALLSHSIRMVCGDHRFELGCKTEAERELWVDRLERARNGSAAAWLGRIAENPVELPFDETTVSSVPVDTVLAPPTTPADAPHPATLPTSMLVAGRSKLSQILGRTSSAMRDTVDLRLADVFSDACLAARYKPAHESKAAVPHRPTASTPLGRRKSFAVLDEKARAGLEAMRAERPTSNHRRRLSLSNLPRSLGGLSGSTSPELTSTPGEGEAGAIPVRRPTMSTSSRPWSGSWRRRTRTESFKGSTGRPAIELPTDGSESAESPVDLTSSSVSLPALAAVAPAGPVVALVNRNGSTSSSSGSSAPPSPSLPTPTDLEGGPKWFNMAPLSRRSRSAVDLPPFATPLQEEQAVAAAKFLRSGGGSGGDRKGWRDSWRNSTMPAGGSLRSREPSLSLLGLFKPTLSPTLPSPAPVAAEPVTSPVLEEPEPIFSVDFTAPPRARNGGGVRSQTMPLPALPSELRDNGGDATPRPGIGQRRKSIKVFRNLTRMTPLLPTGPLSG